MFSLKNKIIIITGGAGLLGTNFVESILSYDGIPIVLDKSQKKINFLKKHLLSKFNKKIISFKCDITNERELIIIQKKVLKKFNKIDCLINNAANNHQPNSPKSNFLENFSVKNWNDDLSVGLTGAFLCSKIFGTQISKNKKGGTIINISSDLGLIAPNQNLYKQKKVNSKKAISYSIVKSGMIGLTKYLSTYWSDKNVRSNCLCPGGIQNNQNKIFLKKIEKLIPLKRMAKQNDYNSTIVWMLSDENCYMNGAVISVDGGRTAW
jgi:NAD(P)-dependent dehydrogenase (short-subunit alcohol dehydrogenase family)